VVFIRLQRHRHPQQSRHDRRGDDRRAEREAAAESQGANAGEGEDEGGIPEGEVDRPIAENESAIHLENADAGMNSILLRQ
jgi:hypothetical protein